MAIKLVHRLPYRHEGNWDMASDWKLAKPLTSNHLDNVPESIGYSRGRLKIPSFTDSLSSVWYGY